MPEQTSSLLWLWILQIGWWLGWMLPLALAGVLIALGFRHLHRAAREVERRPVRAGHGGFGRILRDKLSHWLIGRSMIALITGGLALGGLIGFFVHRLVEPEVGKAVADGLGTSVEPAAAQAQGDPTDLILAAALLCGALVFGAAVHMYRLLRRRATEAARRLSGRVVVRPLLVRWFHDSAKIGMLLVFIGAWLCFGLVMQIVGLVAMLVPLPASVTDLPLEWATPAMAGVLVAVGAIMFGAMLALPIWMAIRHFQLDIRYYRGNPRFRFLANAGATVTAGIAGALAFVGLLGVLGILPPSRWGDLLYGVVPGLWLLAYLIAYAIAIVVQARKRGRKFNLANIALACVLAPFGAVPLFALFWRVHLHFFSRLLG